MIVPTFVLCSIDPFSPMRPIIRRITKNVNTKMIKKVNALCG